MLKTNKWKIKIECDWDAWEKLEEDKVAFIVESSLPGGFNNIKVEIEDTGKENVQ